MRHTSEWVRVTVSTSTKKLGSRNLITESTLFLMVENVVQLED